MGPSDSYHETGAWAALRCGRRFVGIEKDPNFFQVGVGRLQAEEVPQCLTV